MDTVQIKLIIYLLTGVFIGMLIMHTTDEAVEPEALMRQEEVVSGSSLMGRELKLFITKKAGCNYIIAQSQKGVSIVPVPMQPLSCK